jgi:7-cyano-7-deazaguanine reductase
LAYNGRMGTLHDSTLGRAVAYADTYDAGRLFPIPRAGQREALGIGAALPFHGVDIWNAWELSWLDPRGKPQVAVGEFRIPCDSPNLIESKSLKLYLNGFAQERCGSIAALGARIASDLTAVAGAPVGVALRTPATLAGTTIAELEGSSIDGLDIDVDRYDAPAPELLRAESGEPVAETLVSQLLRSNCPVTGQPDWASVQVRYAGPRIDRAGLLRYLVSYRRHSDFHEHCVERIFRDLRARCAPDRLSVYARYTRRGGLDINPWRGTHDEVPPNPRGPRQ